MLYILLHKNTTGTRVELVTCSAVKAVKELVRRYDEALQKKPNDQIESFDMVNDDTVYAEIVTEDSNTEWWEVIPYKEADVE